jgi:hypothetical protein
MQNVLPLNALRLKIAGAPGYYHYILRVSLLTFMIAAGVCEAHAASASGHFQQRLLQLQRSGSCRELPQFGVSTHQRRNPDDVNVRLISEIHAQMARFDIPWMDLEHEGRFDFAPYDRLIGELRRSGKSIDLVLAYGHPDHSDGRAENGFPLPPRTPEQRAAYGRYVQAVANQYHGPDIVYEIWNEPNLDVFWPPAPDASAYAELLAEAVQAIRQVEPKAIIIMGGLANELNPSAFLDTVAKTGALDQLDGIAFHPYRKDGPENSLSDISEIESAVVGRSLTPLWINEWGYSETWFANTEPSQIKKRVAIMTARLMLTVALAKAKVAIVYDLINDGSDPHDIESSFGLFDYDFAPKEAASAFRLMSDIMSTCDMYEFKTNVSQSTVVATFSNNGKASYVIWSYEPNRPVELCFVTPHLHPTELKDVSGNDLPLQACGSDSEVKLKLAEQAGPVILQAESRAAK